MVMPLTAMAQAPDEARAERHRLLSQVGEVAPGTIAHLLGSALLSLGAGDVSFQYDNPGMGKRHMAFPGNVACSVLLGRAQDVGQGSGGEMYDRATVSIGSEVAVELSRTYVRPDSAK